MAVTLLLPIYSLLLSLLKLTMAVKGLKLIGSSWQCRCLSKLPHHEPACMHASPLPPQRQCVTRRCTLLLLASAPKILCLDNSVQAASAGTVVNVDSLAGKVIVCFGLGVSRIAKV